MAKAFSGEYDAIVTAIIEKAKEGDTAAAALYLSRVEPPLRPKAERVTFKLDATLPAARQAEQVVQAVADGDLSPDDGLILMQCVAAMVKLREADDHEERLRALEARDSRAAKPSFGAGLVVIPGLNK